MEADILEMPPGNTSDPQKLQKKWQTEMDAAKKRHEDFLKTGNAVVSRYFDQRGADPGFNLDKISGEQFRLNIFHSNVNTIQSMLFGNRPNSDVSREHQDPDDDIARVAAVIGQRMLDVEYQASGDDISTALKCSLFDRLVPGIGLSRIRYEVETAQQPVTDPMTGQAILGEDGEPEMTEVIVSEDAPIDYVHWQDVRWGWGRTWREVPWIAFRSYLTRFEAKARFDEEKIKTLNFKNQMPSGDEDDAGKDDSQDSAEKAEIWEIWSKHDRTVYWYAQGQSSILDKKDDPLRLNGFFPCPMPMAANLTTTFFMPRADFTIDQDLYNEIDILQTRIAHITRTIKVVGVYDSGAEGVSRMLTEGVENQLIPVENWAAFAEKGGLTTAIDWFPVQDVVQVLTTLRQLLAETIGLLHEVTGLSDLMRGANTDQYTSDGTNQLKAKFGSIRMQALQDDFARFASDLQSLRLEVVGKHFTPESIAKQASVQYMPQADQDKVEPAIDLLKSPDLKWRAEVRPESIALMDYAALKSDRTQYLTALSTYIQSAQAMAKAVPNSMPLLLEFMKFGMAGFKGSDYMEGILDRAIDELMKNPPKQEGDGQAQAQAAAEQAKVRIEEIKAQSKMQSDQMALQIKQFEAQAEKEIEMLRAQNAERLEAMDTQHKIDVENTKLNNQLVVISAQTNAALTETEADTQSALITTEAQSATAIAEEEVEHRNTLIEERNKGNSDA